MILHLCCRGVTPTQVLLLFRPCASTRPREGKSPSDPPEQQRSWRRRHSCCRTVRGRAWGPWWRTCMCRRGWCASLWRRLQLQVVNQVKETPHQPTAKGRCHKSYSSLYSKDVGGGRGPIWKKEDKPPSSPDCAPLSTVSGTTLTAFCARRGPPMWQSWRSASTPPGPPWPPASSRGSPAGSGPGLSTLWQQGAAASNSLLNIIFSS